MLDKNTKIRNSTKLSRNGIMYSGSIFPCKECNKEIFVANNVISKHRGYCRKCSDINKRTINLKNRTCKSCDFSHDISKFLSKTNTNSKLECHKCVSLKKYGITYKDYLDLLTKQDNKCAICDNPETAIDKRSGAIRDLAVDHCHETGRIRSLLCGKWALTHNSTLIKIKNDN